MIAEQSSRQRLDLYFALLLAIAIVLYFAKLGSAPVYILDEAKNAQCAREMWLRGDWIVPTFNNVLRTDKPPLHYFFMRLAYTVWGATPFAARFFSATFGVATIAITYWFARRYLNIRTAFFAGLVLLCSLNLSLEMHFAVPDPYLIFLISAALFTFYHGYTQHKTGHVLLSYVLMALGVLSKGPVAIALPGLTAVCWLLLQKNFNWKTIVRLQPWTGLLIIALIALPWYIAVHKATNGAWSKGFFLEHNLNRFSHIKEGHGGFFLLTEAFVLLGLLPFSIFLIQAFIKAFKQYRLNTFVTFCLLSSCLFILFFTISQTKLPNYTMPCYPLVAILVGHYLNGLTAADSRKLRLPLWLYSIIMLVLPVGLYIALHIEPALTTIAWIAALFVLLPAGALYALWNAYRSNLIQVWWGLAASTILTGIILLVYAYPVAYRHNPVNESMPLLEAHQGPVIAYKDYNPAYNFQWHQIIPVIEDSLAMVSFIVQHKNAMILTRKNESKDLSALPFKTLYSGKDVFETPVSVVLVYQP